MSTRIFVVAVALAAGFSAGAWAGSKKSDEQVGSAMKNLKFAPGKSRYEPGPCDDECGRAFDACREHCGPLQVTAVGARNEKTAEDKKKLLEAAKKKAPPAQTQKCLNDCGKQQLACMKGCK